MTLLGKLRDTNTIVEITKVADYVCWSDEAGWLCITSHVGKPKRLQHDFRWIPASTPFWWVRETAFSSHQN